MKIINFAKSVKEEMTHINWPTKQNILVVTVAVITVSIFIAYYLGFFDWIFKTLLEKYILEI